MISKILGSAFVAACLTMSGTVFAQNYDNHNNGRYNTPSRHSAQNNGHGRNAHPAPPPRRISSARGYDNHWTRGAGPEHRFYKGGWLPAQYRGRRYVVNDWRTYRLSPPPRGYYWVQTGSDFVLAAIATGLIAQIILNN